MVRVASLATRGNLNSQHESLQRGRASIRTFDRGTVTHSNTRSEFYPNGGRYRNATESISPGGNISSSRRQFQFSKD